jgi:hypothetical protein
MPVPNVTVSLHSSEDMLDVGTLDGSRCGAKAVTSTSSASTSCCAVPDSFSDCSDETNIDRLQEAVETVLLGLGEDVQREGLRDTPKVGSQPCPSLVHGCEGREGYGGSSMAVSCHRPLLTGDFETTWDSQCFSDPSGSGPGFGMVTAMVTILGVRVSI